MSMFFKIFVDSWNEERRALNYQQLVLAKVLSSFEIFFFLSYVEVVVKFGVVVVVV